MLALVVLLAMTLPATCEPGGGTMQPRYDETRTPAQVIDAIVRTLKAICQAPPWIRPGETREGSPFAQLDLDMNIWRQWKSDGKAGVGKYGDAFAAAEEARQLLEAAVALYDQAAASTGEAARQKNKAAREKNARAAEAVRRAEQALVMSGSVSGRDPRRTYTDPQQPQTDPSGGRPPLSTGTSRIDVDSRGNRVDWSIFDANMRALLQGINDRAVAELSRVARTTKSNKYLTMNCRVRYKVSRLYDGSMRLDVVSVQSSGDREFDQYVREELATLNGRLPQFPAESRASSVNKSVIIGSHQGNAYDRTPDEFYYE